MKFTLNFTLPNFKLFKHWKVYSVTRWVNFSEFLTNNFEHFINFLRISIVIRKINSIKMIPFFYIENLNKLKQRNNFLTSASSVHVYIYLEWRGRVAVGIKRRRELKIKETEFGPKGVVGGPNEKSLSDATHRRSIWWTQFWEYCVHRQTPNALQFHIFFFYFDKLFLINCRQQISQVWDSIFVFLSGDFFKQKILSISGNSTQLSIVCVWYLPFLGTVAETVIIFCSNPLSGMAST